MTTEDRQVALRLGVSACEALLNKGRPLNVSTGLCAEVWYYFGEHGMAAEYSRDILHDAFATWPEYSGELAYPVPNAEYGEVAAYCEHREHLWDKDTEYGKCRWRLVEWVRDFAQLRLI